MGKKIVFCKIEILSLKMKAQVNIQNNRKKPNSDLN